MNDSTNSGFRVSLELSKVLPVSNQDGLGQIVNARNLHAVLEVKTRFNDWISRRLESIEAESDVDYTVLEAYSNLSNVPQTKEYAITLTTAKQIAMMEGNGAGKAVRKYFISCEQKLLEALKPQQRLTRLEMIELMRDNEIARLETEQQRQVLEHRVMELEPVAQAYDKVVNAEGLLQIGAIAQILGTGRNTLFAFLMHKRVLIADGERRRDPMQDHLNNRHFELKTTTFPYKLPDGQVIDRISTTTYVTAKGLKYIQKLWAEKLEKERAA
jgi:anti-repressor protein